VSKAQRITSIADFIATRYGKSQGLGGLVTVIAVIGVIPYISLQLEAVARTFTILVHYPDIEMPASASQPFWWDTALIVAMLLAAFTILFGTRHLDASERHEGMVAAVAFESIVKLMAFLAVGAFVTVGLMGLGGPDLEPVADTGAIATLIEPQLIPYRDWIGISLLAAFAVMLLPRQFQVAVVEASDERQIRRAIWLFPLYLFLINLFVIPIALSGLLTFPDGAVEADTFVLTVPMAHQQPWLALAVFIGGLSAATGMVIVETVALATMISNDLFLPFLLRRWRRKTWAGTDVGQVLLLVRRLAIPGILLLGYAYHRVAGDTYALVSIGLISFAAIAQFAPAVIGGLYWRGGTKEGAAAGLLAGFGVWLYTLLLPSFAKSGWLPAEFAESGILGIELLSPQALFGLSGWSEITHCLFWSLTANIGAFVLVSSLRAPNAAEAAQASAFVDVLRRGARTGMPLWRGSAEIDELKGLAARFLGETRTERAFDDFARSRGLDSATALPADGDTVELVENLLSGAIGGASARVMVASVTEEEALGLEEVLHILDEASQIRAYSRELERKSGALEAATAELRAANLRLQELDRLKDDFMSSVTHELRTPLAAIRGFSEILHADPELELGERQRFLGILVAETERLSRLVNQVLDLAKIESGTADWKTEQVPLADLIRQTAATTGQLFDDAGIRLDLVLAPEPLTVVADRDRLVQVLVNLLSNAAKYAPRETGRVEVRLVGLPGSARVCVADDGPGIADDELDVVFEKFRQGMGGEKPVGTGLGLPISRRIIGHLGGRIWAEAGCAKGATICFELPLVG
jgi:signal transduction histidine kinase